MLSDELQDQAAVAKRLNVKTKTLEAWRHRGGGPQFIKVGALVRYRPQDVTDFIERNLRGSTSEATK
jgi:hypothetical protein